MVMDNIMGAPIRLPMMVDNIVGALICSWWGQHQECADFDTKLLLWG
jgi:hypothetical protein